MDCRENCPIPEGGYCERHAMEKSPHLVHLCLTRPKYWKAFEEGRLRPPNEPPEQRMKRQVESGGMPSITIQAWNLAESLAAFVRDGCKLTTSEEYQRRLEICDVCEHRIQTRCRKCGCALALKARGRAFKCPIDKW